MPQSYIEEKTTTHREEETQNTDSRNTIKVKFPVFSFSARWLLHQKGHLDWFSPLYWFCAIWYQFKGYQEPYHKTRSQPPKKHKNKHLINKIRITALERTAAMVFNYLWFVTLHTQPMQSLQWWRGYEIVTCIPWLSASQPKRVKFTNSVSFVSHPHFSM